MSDISSSGPREERPLPELFSRLIAPALFILLWSGAFIAVRAGLPYVSPLSFLATRFALASLVLVVVTLAVVRLRRDWTGVGRAWPHLAVSGALINGAYLSGGYLAMTTIKGAMMALVGALAPVVTAIVASRLTDERFGGLQWLGFALGFAGVVIVVGVEPGGFAFSPGLGWAFASMAAIVAGTLYFNRFCRDVPILPSNCIQLGSGAVFCWILVALFESPWVEPSWPLFWSFAYLTVAVSLGAMAIFLFMVKSGTAARAIANLYLTPGVAALMGWALLDEAFPPVALAGFAVSMLGLWLVHRQQTTGSPTRE